MTSVKIGSNIWKNIEGGYYYSDLISKKFYVDNYLDRGDAVDADNAAYDAIKLAIAESKGGDSLAVYYYYEAEGAKLDAATEQAKASTAIVAATAAIKAADVEVKQQAADLALIRAQAAELERLNKEFEQKDLYMVDRLVDINDTLEETVKTSEETEKTIKETGKGTDYTLIGVAAVVVVILLFGTAVALRRE